jgi:hypothetical protein
VDDDDGAGGDDDGDLAYARQRVEELLDERHLGGAADPQHVEVGLLGLAAGRARRRRRRLWRVPHICSALLRSFLQRSSAASVSACPRDKNASGGAASSSPDDAPAARGTARGGEEGRRGHARGGAALLAWRPARSRWVGALK